MNKREDLLRNLTNSNKKSAQLDSSSDTQLPWEQNNGMVDIDKEANSSIMGSIKSYISKIDFSSNRTKLIIGILILLIVFCGFYTYKTLNAYGQNSVKVDSSNINSEQTTHQITVHIGGAVLNPGVYKLDSNSRIMDAVDLAGGLTTNANSDEINLAKILEDGEQIIIPSKNDSTSNNTNSDTISQSSSNNGKVNINNADLATLQTLSGVGPSTAQKIIDYRNANGKFKTIEDLKKVSGIGDKTFAKFSDKICV